MKINGLNSGNILHDVKILQGLLFFLEPVAEGLAGNAEQVGCHRLIACGARERFIHEKLFYFVKCREFCAEGNLG